MKIILWALNIQVCFKIPTNMMVRSFEIVLFTTKYLVCEMKKKFMQPSCFKISMDWRLTLTTGLVYLFFALK